MSAGIRLRAPTTLSALAARHGGEVSSADADWLVTHVTAPEHAARDTDLRVVLRADRVAVAKQHPGPVLMLGRFRAQLTTHPRWLHEHPLWALAKELEEVAPPELRQRPAHRSPVASAELSHVDLAAGAVVFPGATLGAGCSIGPNAVIYPNVHLGERVVVGACAVLGRPGFGWAEGPDGSVRRVPQLAGVNVGDDVEVGPGCTVDAGTLTPTILEAGVKLDAQVHVGHNVRIGAGSLIAAQVGFAGSSRLGRGVRVGGQTGFADHVRVGDRVQVAGKAGVIRDVPDDAVVAGFPAVPRARWLRAMALLLRLNASAPRR